MPQKKHLDMLCIFVCAALAAVSVWFGLRFLLPWLSPFLLAFLTAALAEPAVEFLQRRFMFRRGFASAVCISLFLLSLLGIFTLIVSRCVYELYGFLRSFPEKLSELPQLALSLERITERIASSAPADMRDYIYEAAENLTSKAAEIPAALAGKLASAVSSGITAAPKTILAVLTYAVGAFFVSSGYREITAFIKRQIPAKMRFGVSVLKGDLVATLLRYFKAQLMLMGVTFVILTMAFLVLRIDYAALLALIISFVDALPVFGVGTVLLPWAIIMFISGSHRLAAGLAVTYCIVYITHSALEPKLVGRQIGLHPAATLLSMYVGFCISGLLGMVLFPVALITVKQLNERGFIRLWK